MGKYVNINIKEDIKTLNLLYQKNRNFKIKRRIKSLILTKENKFKTRKQLANYLGVNEKTLYVWTKTYQRDGINAMLIMSGGGKRRQKISDNLKIEIEKKLNDSTSPLQGYTFAVEWIREEFGIEINYHTLRSFMISNFGTKLKQPRKSHYKKDEKAFVAFKKNSKII